MLWACVARAFLFWVSRPPPSSARVSRNIFLWIPRRYCVHLVCCLVNPCLHQIWGILRASAPLHLHICVSVSISRLQPMSPFRQPPCIQYIPLLSSAAKDCVRLSYRYTTQAQKLNLRLTLSETPLRYHLHTHRKAANNRLKFGSSFPPRKEKETETEEGREGRSPVALLPGTRFDFSLKRSNRSMK